MPRYALVRAHTMASIAAGLVVAAFIVASVSVEVLGDEDSIRAVKRAILVALAILVPAMAITALTGRRLAGRSQAAVIVRKRKRMSVIGITGVVILIPCAITLDRLAAGGELGIAFGLVQTTELLAGGLNLGLLLLNFRDGRALTAKRRARAA